METIEFKEQTVIFAKNQPEYNPLPAHVSEHGRVTCCWKLSDEELEEVIKTKCIWHQIDTFRSLLQPQLLTTEKPLF